MIKLTLEQLNESWRTLESLVSQKMPAGAFRRNIRKIFEQCEPEFLEYQKEMSSLLVEFSCTPNGNGTWNKPIDEGRRKEFEERFEGLQKTVLEIKGDQISENDFESYGIVLSPVDEIFLSRWLIVQEEFSVEIDQGREMRT